MGTTDLYNEETTMNYNTPSPNMNQQTTDLYNKETTMSYNTPSPNMNQQTTDLYNEETTMSYNDNTPSPGPFPTLPPSFSPLINNNDNNNNDNNNNDNNSNKEHCFSQSHGKCGESSLCGLCLCNEGSVITC